MIPQILFLQTLISFRIYLHQVSFQRMEGGHMAKPRKS